METDLRSFWARFQTGIEVAVASSVPESLLGVRDGFLRYFHTGLHRDVPVAVVPHPQERTASGLSLSDEEVLTSCRRRALELSQQFGDQYQFYVSSEGGLHSLELNGGVHYFVRSWTAILSTVGEAWGSSGSVEIPSRLLRGLEGDQVPFAIPGTRRSGGMISSLTGGLESRRSAVTQSTVHALSSLFYGILKIGPPERRWDRMV